MSSVITIRPFFFHHHSSSSISRGVTFYEFCFFFVYFFLQRLHFWWRNFLFGFRCSSCFVYICQFFFVCQLYKVVERPVFGRTQVGLSPTPTLPEYMTMFGLSLLNQLVLANPPPNYLPDILFRIHIYLASYLFSSSCCYYYYKTHSDRSNQTT